MTIAKNWLIFVLVVTFGGAVAGMFAGGITGAILSVMGSPQLIQIAAGIAGFVAGLPVSYLAFRWRVKRLLCDVSGDTFA